MFLIMNALAAQANDENKFFCDVCQIIVEGVYEEVKDPQSIQEVEAFLEQICDVLPFDLFNWCEKIIQQYYEELVHNILEGYPPKVVCQNVGICNA